MKRREIKINKDAFPGVFANYFSCARVFDSSCSPEAKVYFIDRDVGYFLKVSEKGTLKREAELDAYFGAKGLGARVVSYLSEDKDYLLTERVIGEDCTDARYLADPKKLCDLIAKRLRALHSLDFSDCKVKNRNAEYIETLKTNHKNGKYDPSFLPPHMAKMTSEEAYGFALGAEEAFACDALIHGDYCLPNIILDDWRFSGFVDLGNGGVGERHIDLFWGAWTLAYNLKTDEYRDRFFDAYGRDAVDPDKLEIVAACEAFG